MSAAKLSDILIIMGSVRAGRRCPQIAQWVRGITERSCKFACETIDLRDWHLPADDEAGMPSQGAYAQAHTRAWSNKVTRASGIMIVTPQYNWGYPAPLKNALDHLYKEWSGKPLAIITYGGHGGGRCGVQLLQVAEGLKMRPVATMPAITIAAEAIRNNMPQGIEELTPFENIVIQAVDELGKLIS